MLNSISLNAIAQQLAKSPMLGTPASLSIQQEVRLNFIGQARLDSQVLLLSECN
ncbi:hypothetical protein H6F74_11410 [Trichocoleus sp. FACHB-90]|uniref:hypothetical protein n=1 Tax=Cyanophyceae TaxID=3028117 RepID=UPI0016826FE0|nr:hypothetical protein [Trichocoleus sp. FACHB-90]MBD1926851.1 hypothetical protein [Trichocoleus sp. FACHB-90]